MEVVMYLLKAHVPSSCTGRNPWANLYPLIKKEEWKSETQMLEQFGEYELQLHMDSGSVEYTENPWTAGVWHYRDKGDLVKRTKVT